MQPIRKINESEKAILKYLIKQTSLQLPDEWYQNLLVQKMDDGGMGSFLIFQDESQIGIKRKFGKQVSEYQYIDDDGATVLVSLNVDEKNKPFEVDVWKTDYNPVLSIKVPMTFGV
jgi:hypothetical protein